MKTKYTVTLAMVSSFAIGAAAVQVLHAQAKAPAFLIAEIAVTNQDAYIKEFAPPVTKSQEDYGGKYLARGGRTISFLGEPPKSRVVIVQFESFDKLQAWKNSSATKDAFLIGQKYATFREFGVEGVSP